MNEVIHVFKDELFDTVTGYSVRVVGGQREDRLWEGRLEFVAHDGGTLRTDRETVQSSAEALRYWATGLEAVYLEGALERAKRMPRVAVSR